ncbi:hypothetical protein ACT8ZV_13145 [Nocardioides sp. MAHUQ-72]|uniref:hypothetical protein n=1 Tax=unclassified Nocardioides TaxID=2615069 RepID=UPI0036075388
MATDLGTTAQPTAPPATRAGAPGWRDPRLWVGVLIVAVSVVAGARLLSSADDTVQVWSAATDLGAGDTVGADDLVATRVRFADEAALEGYFAVDDELPADLELVRGVGSGELLPRAAVGSAGASDLVQLPVAVDAELVPGSVRTGSVVDVYLVATGQASAGLGEGRPALTEVDVVDAPPVEDGFAASGKRQLVLAVAEPDARRFFRLLGAAESPVLTVVRRG